MVCAMTLQERVHDLVSGNVTVLLGIGHPWRGDDGVGTALAQQLVDSKDFHVLVCEEVPENFTGPVRAFHPQTILLVDAVDAGAQPGDVLFLAADELNGIGVSAHHPSLRPLMSYLAQETGAQVVLLGIQPHPDAKAGPLSTEVAETLQVLKAVFSEAADIPHKDIS